MNLIGGARCIGEKFKQIERLRKMFDEHNSTVLCVLFMWRLETKWKNFLEFHAASESMVFISSMSCSSRIFHIYSRRKVSEYVQSETKRNIQPHDNNNNVNTREM